MNNQKILGALVAASFAFAGAAQATDAAHPDSGKAGGVCKHACKGKGGCKGESGCKGKNACKTEGKDLSATNAKDCKKQHGIWEAHS